MAEQSLSIPEIQGSNTVMGKIYDNTHLMLTVEKTKINKKRPRMAHLEKNYLIQVRYRSSS